MGSGGAGECDQFKNTPEMNKILKDPNGVSRRIFVYGITPQDGQIDRFRSELERTFRKYGLIEAMIVKKRFSFVQFLNESCAATAIRQENGKEFLGQKMDVKEAKAPPKREEPEPDEEDSGNVPSYNIASSLAETLKNIPKEDLEPPRSNPSFNNERSSSGGDHNFDSNMGGGRGGGFPSHSDRGGRGGGRGGDNSSPRGGYHGGGGGGGFPGAVNNGGPGGGGRGGFPPMGGRGERGGRGRGGDEGGGRGGGGRGGEMRGGGRGGDMRGRGRGEWGGGRGGRGGGGGAFNYSRPGSGNSFDEDSQGFDSPGPNSSPLGGPMGRGRGSRFDRGGRGGGPPPGGDRWNQPEDRFGGPPNDRWEEHGPPGPRIGGPPPHMAHGPPGPHHPPGAPHHVSNEDRTNDVEIIVCDRNLTEYAEFIEIKLKKIQLAVDLLFPKDDVPLDKVLGNISSRGTLYAIVVMHQHEQRRSMTLHILHGGVPQEHRNIPVEDALELVDKNFQAYKKGAKNAAKTGPGGIEVSLKTGLPLDTKHPDLMQDLLSRIADNKSLSALEYERVISYLQERREKQCLLEVNDTDLTEIMSKKISSDKPDTSVAPNTQNALQNRIMGLLNKPKTNNFSEMGGPPQGGGFHGAHGPPPQVPAGAAKKEPILQDPTVQRALQSLFQGNKNPLMGGGRGGFGR